MPRQARIAVAAQVDHVVSRGNNRERFWDAALVTKLSSIR